VASRRHRTGLASAAAAPGGASTTTAAAAYTTTSTLWHASNVAARERGPLATTAALWDACVALWHSCGLASASSSSSPTAAAIVRGTGVPLWHHRSLRAMRGLHELPSAIRPLDERCLLSPHLLPHHMLLPSHHVLLLKGLTSDAHHHDVVLPSTTSAAATRLLLTTTTTLLLLSAHHDICLNTLKSLACLKAARGLGRPTRAVDDDTASSALMPGKHALLLLPTLGIRGVRGTATRLLRGDDVHGVLRHAA
jgi:hypothetical protein